MNLERHHPRSHEEWLGLRKGRLTSSLVAAALGHSPYATPLEAWAEVTGRGTFDGNKATMRGTYLEPVVLDYPCRGRGAARLKRKPAPFVRGEWSADSSDCLYVGPNALLVGEGKTANGEVAKGYGDEGTDDIPQHVLIQCMWHLAHWPEAEGCVVPVLVGDQYTFEFREYFVNRDRELVGLLLEQGERWFRDHVATDKPPTAVFRDDEALRIAWPEAIEGKTVEPTPELHALCLDYIAAREEASAAEKAKKSAGARLRQLLTDAQGVDGGHWKVTYKNNKGGQPVTDWEALARELGATEADAHAHPAWAPGAPVLEAQAKESEGSMSNDGAALANIQTNDEGALVPTNLREHMEMCRLLADSEMVPKAYRGKPGNVFAALQLGADLGLKPMAALQSIASINGQPALYSDGLLAVCRSHAEWGRIEEVCDGETASCTVTRLEMTASGGRVATPYTRTFSMTDAKRAKLAEKSGPWQEYPQRMLQMRARSWALRDAFADALKGIKAAEEAQDVIEVEATVEPPKRGTAGLKAALKADNKPPAPTEPAPTQQQEASANEALAFIKDAVSLEQLEGADWEPVKALPNGLQAEVRGAFAARRDQLKAEAELGTAPNTGEVQQ